jgi:TRAP-type C4-dicarboxylate transport system permease small subunit
MALIGYSVVMRYFLNQPIAWVDELAGYLLVGSVMLAAADALLGEEHISVDILVERLSARGRHVSLLVGLSRWRRRRPCSRSRGPTWWRSRAWSI